MKTGDEAFFYHSGDERQIVGIMRITREAPARPQGRRLGLGRGRAGAAVAARSRSSDQGRADARQDGADPPVAPVGRAGARRGMADDPRHGRTMILLFLAAAAAQPQAGTPRAFLERTYASYGSPNFNPFDHLDRYFAPRLIAALRENSRLAHDEVGYVDGDPICQCQDPDGLHAKITRVTLQGAGKASAEVASTGSTPPLGACASASSARPGAGVSPTSRRVKKPSFLRAVEISNRKARRTTH